jgi:hypothetical protein
MDMRSGCAWRTTMLKTFEEQFRLGETFSRDPTQSRHTRFARRTRIAGMTKFTAPAQAASMKLDRVEFMILSLGVVSLAALLSAAMALR